MEWLETVIAPVLSALVGGGIVTAWFVHRREGLKVAAETAQLNWTLLNNEIERQAQKITAQDLHIAEIEKAHRDCERRQSALEAKIAKLEAILQGLGEGRQRVQEWVSEEHVRDRREQGNDDAGG